MAVDRRVISIAAKVPNLPTPPSTRDMRLCCDAVVQAVRQAFDICAKDTKGYTYKTVARKVIAVMAEPGDVRLSASGAAAHEVGGDGNVWDGLRMQELLQWMPDEEDFLQPLTALSCQEARQLFAMSPPWISCFTCYISAMSKAQCDVLFRANSLEILVAIEKFEKANGFAPSIITIANMLS